MVSVSGLEIKFGRIALVICAVVALTVLYRRYGSGWIVRNEDVTNGIASERSHFSELPPTARAEPTFVTTLKLSVNCTLNYTDTGSSNKLTVILLHGSKFNSFDWIKIGTIQNLTSWDYRVIALNITPPCLKEPNMLSSAVTKLKVENVVIVSPSSSGLLSIPYATEETNYKSIKGLVFLAPVIPEKLTGNQSVKYKGKVLIMYGGNDQTFIDRKGKEKLEGLFEDVESLEIKDGAHAFYNAKPSLWHAELKKFLEKISKS